MSLAFLVDISNNIATDIYLSHLYPESVRYNKQKNKIFSQICISKDAWKFRSNKINLF